MKNAICLLGCLCAGSAHAIPTFIGNFDDNTPGSYTLSTGNPAGSTGGPDNPANVEAFLALALGGTTIASLAPAPASLAEGSALKEAFTVAVGDTFSFDWEWNTEEFPDQDTFNDFAFFSFTINPTDQGVLADTFSANPDSGTFSQVMAAAGTLNWGVGVMDQDASLTGFLFDSSITVSNITLDQALPPSIPEPGSLALLALGLAGFGWSRRRTTA